MQTKPDDLTDANVADAAAYRWGLPEPTAMYRPVGYGSHHWAVTDAVGQRWFASVDLLDEPDPDAQFENLAAALGLATSTHDAGLMFAVGPVRGEDGSHVQRLRHHYAMALYPHVVGQAGGFGDAFSSADAGEVAKMLAALHALDVEKTGRGSIPVETFEIPGRSDLEEALADVRTNVEWDGPYGGDLHRILDRHADQVVSALRRHDSLLDAAGAQPNQLVPTHGEPHMGNLIRAAEGLMLIDWDSAMLAPPERDVWMVAERTNGRGLADYEAASGRTIDPDLIERYRLAWALADLADYAVTLRDAGKETDDTAWMWDAFTATILSLP